LHDAPIRDCCPVRITGEVLDDDVFAFVSALRKNVPFLRKSAQKFENGTVVLMVSVDRNLPLTNQLCQTIEEFPSENFSQSTNREQNRLAALSPRSICEKGASRDEAMDVRVIPKILRPRMENTHQIGGSTEPLWILRELEKCFCRCPHEEIKKLVTMSPDDCIEFMGKGEDYMKGTLW